MNNLPLTRYKNVRLISNEYLCSDLVDAAKYVNSFHAHLSETTNLNHADINHIVKYLNRNVFNKAKELTIFLNENSSSTVYEPGSIWTIKNNRLKAKDIQLCLNEIYKHLFKNPISVILDLSEFNFIDLFSFCSDPGVLLNPRTGYGDTIWNYTRYRVDKHGSVALCINYHDISDKSNSPYARPYITVVSRGESLIKLIDYAFKYCKVTNLFKLKNDKIQYYRIGKIKFNERDLKREGKDFLEDYGDYVEEQISTVLDKAGLLISLIPGPASSIIFEYRPDKWKNYLSVIRTELRKLNVPSSTTILSNSHPCTILEYNVY